MRCRRARKLLSAYTDGALTLYEMVSLKEHLARCRPCRDELQALRRLNRGLAALGEEVFGEEPFIDWSAFEQRLSERLAREELDLGLPWYRRRGVRGAAAAVLVLAVLVVGIWMHVRFQPTMVCDSSDPLGPGTTLRRESRGPVRARTWVSAGSVSPLASSNQSGLLEASRRLAWLAGSPRYGEGGEWTRVIVRYHSARGEAVEHRYVFRNPDR